MSLEPLRPVSGRDLRYVLTVVLLDADRALSIHDLCEALSARGLVASGYPRKTIADALRWEVRRGRVLRHGRGRVRAGQIPRSTRWWLRQHARLVAAGGSVDQAERDGRLARAQR